MTDVYVYLESIRDLQDRKIPQVLKAAKKYKESIRACIDCGNKFTDSWNELTATLDKNNEWRKEIDACTQKHHDLTNSMQTLETGLDIKFIQAIEQVLPGEREQTNKKENDVKNALTKYDYKRKRKGTQSGAMPKGALSLIRQDIYSHAEQTYFILLQALCLTLTEFCSYHWQSGELSKLMSETVQKAQSKTPDMSKAPKMQDMKGIYSADDTSGHKRKRGTIIKNKKKRVSTPPSNRGLAEPLPESKAMRSISFNVASSPPQISCPSPRTRTLSITEPEQTPPNNDNSTQEKQPKQKMVRVKVVRARWKFTAERASELSLEPGDVVVVTDFTRDDWWKASSGEQEGLIPANYVEVIEEKDVPAQVEESDEEEEETEENVTTTEPPTEQNEQPVVVNGGVPMVALPGRGVAGRRGGNRGRGMPTRTPGNARGRPQTRTPRMRGRASATANARGMSSPSPGDPSKGVPTGALFPNNTASTNNAPMNTNMNTANSGTPSPTSVVVTPSPIPTQVPSPTEISGVETLPSPQQMPNLPPPIDDGELPGLPLPCLPPPIDDSIIDDLPLPLDNDTEELPNPESFPTPLPRDHEEETTQTDQSVDEDDLDLPPPPSLLPDGWGEYQTDEGHTYYYNHNTGASSWVVPT
eukprot:CAMPEP_0174277540 /NCGR_PEP_ID=MMETSP0439-20130205/60987_1 /TAXON_ID=0 /ORGANISM="Stereomyxa ramosa, Strain Chinc5" /LENGTH=641 /DNA_ID=CAMNT_0015369871 /DNA_START=451 /DNA_END=2376 /DNA_ORIENTATION=+